MKFRDPSLGHLPDVPQEPQSDERSSRRDAESRAALEYLRSEVERDKQRDPDAERRDRLVEKQKPRVEVHEINISPSLCEDIQARKGGLATRVDRKAKDKVLDYFVIDGNKIREHFPQLWEMIPRFQAIAEELYGEPLEILHDQAGININIVGPGGEQGFHCDRNPVTMILYLSMPEGGALEYQTEKEEVRQVQPRPGTLATLVSADKLLHRVTPVQGKVERMALVVSFGKPEKDYAESGRDDFLYTGDKEVKDQKVFE
jgi:hypothetical protein